jgi:hypothetical protein
LLTTTAIEDATARYGVTAHTNAIVFEHVPGLPESRDRAAMLTTFGGLLCFLAWLLCAMFWPPKRIENVAQDANAV